MHRVTDDDDSDDDEEDVDDNDDTEKPKKTPEKTIQKLCRALKTKIVDRLRRKWVELIRVGTSPKKPKGPWV